MKKIMMILTALLMSMVLVFPAMADSHPPRLVDEADLLTADKEARVMNELNCISEELQFDVAIVTVDSLEGKSAQEYADDYYDNNGYGMGTDYDGAMLVVSMSEREWHITTCGYGMAAIPDSEVEAIGGQFVDYLSEGLYEEAFLVFATCCEAYVSVAYDAGIEYVEEDYAVSAESKNRVTDTLLALLGSLGVGFLIAFLPMSAMKKQMKTVAFKAEAKDYLVPGSRHLTMSHDQFLYHTINRTPRPKNTSSGGGGHISSSGRSHGGGGGKF